MVTTAAEEVRKVGEGEDGPVLMQIDDAEDSAADSDELCSSTSQQPVDDGQGEGST